MPTIDMSPFSTLKSCGSSSMLYLRMKRPTFVMRGSFSSFTKGFSLSAFLLVLKSGSAMTKSSEISIISVLSPINCVSVVIGMAMVSALGVPPYWFSSLNSLSLRSASLYMERNFRKSNRW